MLENYAKNSDGVVFQIEKKVIEYDQDYVNNSYVVYEPLPTYMGYLRLGNIVGSLGRIPKSILDVGYGNGSFLKVCQNVIAKCYGFDISAFPVPDGCIKVDSISENFYEVITFFDSLEHFENIEFIKDLNCNSVCISVPCCHYKNDQWFEEWKHRRPNEHLWHFNKESLESFMKRMGYVLRSLSNIEDTIRKNKEDEENILTAFFVKAHL